MATEGIAGGSISGNESTLAKIQSTETQSGGSSNRTTGPVDNLDVNVDGDQAWSGSGISNSNFHFSGSAPSNALYTPQNSLRLDLNSSKNKFYGANSEDSISFGRRTNKDTVKLGQGDGAADLVELQSLKKVRDLKIKNFGKEDSLKVGKKTFDYDQLQDKSFKNISIKFD